MPKPGRGLGTCSEKKIVSALHCTHSIIAQSVNVKIAQPPPELNCRGLNEVFLWHGCSTKVADIIVNFGFDERLANDQDLYGAGSYFTVQVCKALQYSRGIGCSVHQKRCGSKICSCPGDKCLLLCRVVLGDPYFAQSNERLKGQRHPPARPDVSGMQYDSVFARPGIRRGRDRQQHNEYVLFDGSRIYPEYLVKMRTLPNHTNS